MHLTEITFLWITEIYFQVLTNIKHRKREDCKTKTNVKILLKTDIKIQTFEPPNDKTNKMTCAPGKDSDQPGHQSSQCAQWVAKDPSFLHADREDSDQTGRTVFTGCTGHFVGFVMRWLICFLTEKEGLKNLLMGS